FELVRVQKTLMQTGVDSLYENPESALAGVTATPRGLEAMHMSRIGAKGSANISISDLNFNELLQGHPEQYTHTQWDLATEAGRTAQATAMEGSWHTDLRRNLVIA